MTKSHPNDDRADENIGRAFLVGAGPGDAALITLRGAECLQRADVVLYDYLVNPRILEHTKCGAVLVCLGRHGQGRIMTPEEVCSCMVEAALRGKDVVRLKGGDPMIFARAAEEISALKSAGIEFEIVPGITAAQAVGSYAGVPLTQRDVASSIAFVTGQLGDSQEPVEMDYAALACFPGTLVFYMAVTTARQWSQGLIDAGKPAHTPTAIVRRCSWPDQKTFDTTLGEVAEEIESRGLRPPVVAIVGQVARRDPAINWFASRPLFGRKILVTRAVNQADSLARLLEELGAVVLRQPAIEISAPTDCGPLDAALARLDTYDWLVFASANGVRHLLDRLLAGNRDIRQLGKVKLAAIGPTTADELQKYHLVADLVPPNYRAESLAEALSGDAAGARILLVRASRGRETLGEELVRAGARVDQVIAYQSSDVTTPYSRIATALSAGSIDFVTVTSSAIARSLVRMFGEDLRRAKLASISPITTETLLETGHGAGVEATEYTIAGLVEAICESAANG